MPPTILFKLGGSLLTLPDLPDRIAQTLNLFPVSRALIVVGGGAAADVVREWDATHQQGKDRAHWLAIRALTFNAHLVSTMIRESVVVKTRTEAASAWDKDRVVLLDAYEYVKRNEPHSDVPLPHHWSATSDTVAAWTAINWPVDEFVLLKSTDIPQSYHIDEAAQAGVVDSELPALSNRLPPTSVCNVRADVATLTKLQLTR